MITATVVFDVLFIAGGYVAAIYTWPWLRTKFIGAEAEAAKLRARAADVIAKVRGL